ncbi:MAG: hypothetical protein IT162_01770 [Bryobacterales bacterium]|nr:hypothetical protein [Bryobacterales bacterium]
MTGLLQRIHKSDRVLSATGWLTIACAFFGLCAAPWDTSALAQGAAHPWAKVIRYSLGLTLHTWTLALFLGHLAACPAALRRIVRWGASACALITVGAITIQAMRGMPSHYNVATSTDAILFAVLSASTLASCAFVLLLLFLYLWLDVDLPRAYVMGIRLGFVLFIIGGLEGMIMVVNQAHTIGAPDGGPGLPLLSWSTKAGDLRAAHLAGVFAIQALPLAGWLIGRVMKDRQLSVQLGAVTALALAWVWIFRALLMQAVAGRPVLTVAGL